MRIGGSLRCIPAEPACFPMQAGLGWSGHTWPGPQAALLATLLPKPQWCSRQGGQHHICNHMGASCGLRGWVLQENLRVHPPGGMKLNIAWTNSSLLNNLLS